ncbi:MAG: hypothetical protein K8S18_04955 [Desulfobacula sp.]|nr:hypothetical protein [Desulfobacula sp.]
MPTLTLRPNAAGDHTNLDTYPVDDNNYECVDDTGSGDGDTTRVEQSSGGSAYDLYSLPNHSSESGTINSVKVYARCKVSQDAANDVRTKIKTHSTEYTGSSESATTSYVLYSTTYTTNPNTSNAWTWAEIDALQAGVYLEESDFKGTVYCTQVYVEVDYTLSAIQGVVAESINFSDSITKQAIFTVLAQESINLADSDQNIGSFIAAIIEQLVLSDLSSKTAIYPVSASDSFTVSDAVSVLQKIISLVSDNIAVSDTTAGRSDLAATAADALEFSETLINSLQAQAIANEIINLSETITAADQAVISALVSEIINISDSTVTRADLLAVILDTVSLSDAAVNILSAMAMATDALNLSDAVFWQGILSAFVTDN